MLQKICFLIASVIFASAMLVPLAVAQDKNEILDFIDSRYENTAYLARTLWEFAEVGYQETRSSALLQETLLGEGFAIEAGVASIPTAFIATYGTGGPVIAILFDPARELDYVCTTDRGVVRGAPILVGVNLVHRSIDFPEC